MRALPGLVAALALLAAPAWRAQQLVVGIEDAQGSFMIDANTGASTPVIPTYGPSAMAVDLDNVRVVFTVGSSLYSYLGGTTAALGQVQYQGTPISPAGMGWYNGRVYFTTVDGIEGLYWLSLTNGQATLVAPFPSAAIANVGGFDIDVSSGRFFGTNDNATLQGLVEINPTTGALTLIAPYPPGEDDVDGLAAGDGRLFLITDDNTPAMFAIYDIDEGAYSSTTLPNPFTGSHVSSGGAYIPFPYQSLVDNGGYSYRTCHTENGPTSGFVDIAATGEPLSLVDDGETNLTLPFSFPFYGTSYTGIRVGNNGGIMIGATTGDRFSVNKKPIPIATLGASLMPLWDDLDSDSGDVYWQTFTTCPNPDGGGGACAIV